MFDSHLSSHTQMKWIFVVLVIVWTEKVCGSFTRYLEGLDSTTTLAAGSATVVDSCDGSGLDFSSGGAVQSPLTGLGYVGGTLSVYGITIMTWVWVPANPSDACQSPVGSLQACVLVSNPNTGYISDSEPPFGVFYHPGTNSFICKRHGDSVTLPVPATERWVHVSCTFAASDGYIRIFTDFVNEATTNVFASIVLGTLEPIEIGGYVSLLGNVVDGFRGKLDSVKVLPGEILSTSIEVLDVGCHKGNLPSQQCDQQHRCPSNTVAPSTDSPTATPIPTTTKSPEITPLPSGVTVAPSTPKPVTVGSTPLPDANVVSLSPHYTYAPVVLTDTIKVVMPVEKPGASLSGGSAPNSTETPIVNGSDADVVFGSDGQSGDGVWGAAQVVVVVSCVVLLTLCAVWALIKGRYQSEDEQNSDIEIPKTPSQSVVPSIPPSPAGGGVVQNDTLPLQPH
eukprot:TRINITY_DN12402_c0_g1_i2.p1 TRINITY_DN12402_c0_g1~~TRINITY_DN12402_c0_g1_i2.p1  ORF type:complete len:452 (+),score=57.97 TRINITY_DN12402_c0_g1_i2:588-1943(+)